jgi:hypothetical protein
MEYSPHSQSVWEYSVDSSYFDLMCEYYVEYCQSHIKLLWIWIMLWRTDLETQFLELRHISRPKAFRLGLPNCVLKPMCLERVWPPPLSPRPTSYMLKSFGCFFTKLEDTLSVPINSLAMLGKFPWSFCTWAGYFLLYGVCVVSETQALLD